MAAKTGPTGRPSNDPFLVELGDLRRRLNDGHVYRMGVSGNPERFRIATNRWYAREKEYLEALSEYRTTTSRDRIRAARDELTARLERGWEMGESAEVADQFSTLLCRLEAAEDGLYGHARAERVLASRDELAIKAWFHSLPKEDRDGMAAAPVAAGVHEALSNPKEGESE